VKKDEAIGRVAAYSRVSTAEQATGDFTSLDAQEARSRAFCKSQNGFESISSYVDPGYSGATMDRPGLHALLRDIRSGKIDTILVYKFDRLTRSSRDFQNLLQLFEEQGVRLISVTENIDATSPIGRLARNVMANFAEFEREVIAERTRDKMYERAVRGMWNGGTPPYGFNRVDKRLRVVASEAEHVRFIFNGYFQDPSVSTLREELHRRQWFTRSGGKWGKNTLLHILHNPVYIGKIQFNGQLFDGQHESIIENTLFESVQALLPNRNHPRTQSERVFLLKSLIKCGESLCFMSPHYTQKTRRDGSKYNIPYYRCTKVMHFDSRACSIRSVNANQIEKLVIDEIMALSLNQEMLQSSVDALNQDLAQRAGPLADEAQSLKTRITKLDAELERYVRALGQGKLSLPRLEKAVAEAEAHKHALEEQLWQVERKIQESEFRAYNAEFVQRALSDFQSLFNELSRKEQSEMLGCLLKQVTVEKDKVILDIFELPELALGSKNRSRRLPGLDSNRYARRAGRRG